jgi:UvrD-like helicase family protein
MTENVFTPHTEPQAEPTLRRNLELPKGVLQKNLKTFVYLGAALLVIVAALFSSSGKKTPAQQASAKGQPPQPALQDNTDSNVQELKNQLQAERQKEQQATMAAAAMGDSALASATPQQRAAAAAYGPTGVAVPCIPGQPCPQAQQGNMQMQLTPVQQQAQLIAAKERERADNSRFASNLVYSRSADPPQQQQQGQTMPTQYGPAERQTNSSLVSPPAERKQEDTPAGYKRPLEANVDSAVGQPYLVYDALQQQGRMKEIPNAEERVRTIAKSYVESPDNTLIVSPDNASRRELNLAVRQELKASGSLAPEDHAFRVLVQRQDMTGAERSWASQYEINDLVRYTRGSKTIGIEAAAYASVVAINPAANLLTVEKANHELATYDPRRLTGVSVYQEIERELSVGDRIQFTAPDKSLGVANRDMAAIEAIHPDGRLSVRLDNNRQIEFSPNEHRHLDHGYAVTSHSSQGLTAERVLVHADTSVHPDLLNSRFAYVSISRASHEATLFTDDLAKLGPQLGAEVSKTSALEINQASSIAQGIGLRI